MKALFLPIYALSSKEYSESRRPPPRSRPGELSLMTVERNPWHVDIDPLAIARLNALVTRTGADVVVTSGARCGDTVADSQNLLRREGFKGAVVSKVGDCKRRATRHTQTVGTQVWEWLDNHKECRRFAILDRYRLEDRYGELAHLTERFVHAPGDLGLLDTHVDQLAKLLGPRGDVPEAEDRPFWASWDEEYADYCRRQVDNAASAEHAAFLVGMVHGVPWPPR